MAHLLLDIDWNFFDRDFMGDRVSDYFWCVGIIVGTLLLKRPLANVLTRIASRIAMRFSYVRHKNMIRSTLFKPMERLLQVVLDYVAVHQIDNFFDHFVIKRFIGTKNKINIKLGDLLDHVFLFFFIVFLTQVASGFVDLIYYIRMSKAEEENNYSRMQLLPLTKEIAKLVLWILSAFWILGQVFMVNIPALITGLGIGGVAIALAGKETIENFFAAFTILSDKPFKTGDTIKLGEMEGVVERIGFRSTRVRSAEGSAYIIPNQNLVSKELVNLSMRDNRIVKLIAHIRYGISAENLHALTAKIREELLHMRYVQEPIEILIESFEKETFQLVITYNLPHPLPDDATLNAIKRDVSMKVFGTIAEKATLGAPPTTT